MIKITVELWPFGDSTKAKLIASGKIWNDGTGNLYKGSYGFELYRENGSIFSKGNLGEFFRHNSVWKLIAAVTKVSIPSPENNFRDSKIVSRVENKYE